MKTKLTLTIIGAFQVLQSILYTLLADSSIDMMFNVGEEAGQLAVMFQYAITPAFLMIGLMFLFSRNLAVEDAKKLLLAFIIAYLPLFGSFYYMASSPLTQMGLPDFAIDFVMFGLAVFTYLKPKG
jgi:hypothetical protein|tara:strand:+ start:313 stop:690 length:378 start_codon:yes stop_codon:yes gene_type:complete